MRPEKPGMYEPRKDESPEGERPSAAVFVLARNEAHFNALMQLNENSKAKAELRLLSDAELFDNEPSESYKRARLLDSGFTLPEAAEMRVAYGEKGEPLSPAEILDSIALAQSRLGGLVEVSHNGSNADLQNAISHAVANAANVNPG